MGLKLHLDPIGETTFQVRHCQFASFRMAAQTTLQPNANERMSKASSPRPVKGLKASLVIPDCARRTRTFEAARSASREMGTPQPDPFSGPVAKQKGPANDGNRF